MKGKRAPSILSAEFVVSSPSVASCPEQQFPEYAFIGRSNVGKSSLINMLTATKSLAKISQTPGKTRLINHFLLNKEWFLVDLPGYGYAKISKSERKKWKDMINTYLLKRENLVCTFILVDSRHEPQKPDTDFMAWMSTKQLPFVIVFTKTDKLSKTRLEISIGNYVKEMMESWQDMPQFFISSATTSLGRDEILAYIKDNNKHYSAFVKSNK